MKKEISEMKNYPTVGDMLKYIRENDIPMDAIVMVEQLTDYYLENEDDSKNWDYCENYDGIHPTKILPVHHCFGSNFYKKAFVMWMHY